MSFTKPYRQHNYIGEHLSDIHATDYIKGLKWDTNYDGTGNVPEGIWYFNTTEHEYRAFVINNWKPFLQASNIDAIDVAYDNTTYPSLPNNVQGAIDTIYSDIQPMLECANHIGNTIYVNNKYIGATSTGTHIQPFKTLKEACVYVKNTIQPNDSDRCLIHIENGYYIENNPIIIPPYTSIWGNSRNGSKIVPMNIGVNLFEFDTGSYNGSMGELVLYCPVMAYGLYSGSGCYPMFALDNVIFVGIHETSNGAYVQEETAGFELTTCKTFYMFNKYVVSNGRWKETNHLLWDNTFINRFAEILDHGEISFYLFQNESINVNEMFYSNGAHSKLVIYGHVSKSGTTLTTGPNANECRFDFCEIRGNNFIDGGIIKLHDCEFIDNSKIDATTGNCKLLYLTQCRNINTNTYCIRFTGNNSKFLSTTNYLYSPSGINSIILDGTFSMNIVEGVEQVYIPYIDPNDTYSITHYPDIDNTRIFGMLGLAQESDIHTIEYNANTENRFNINNPSDIDFTNIYVKLNGIGLQPYAHYHLNEASGITAYDSSGNNRNGTLKNMELSDWITGKLNGGLRFDNWNEYVDCGHVASFNYNTPFSVEFWMKCEWVCNSYSYIVSKQENSGNRRGWSIQMKNGGKFVIELRYNNSNKLRLYSSQNNFDDGNWHHVVMTYNGNSDASGINLYVDNVNMSLDINKNTLNNKTILNNKKLQISGRDGDHGCFEDGKIDEVVIYDKELNSLEINYRWNNGNGIEEMPSEYSIANDNYIVTNTNQLNVTNWTYINSITINQEVFTNTQIKLLFSIDNKSTWKYWDLTQWQTSSLLDGYINGNVKTVLESLSAANWDDLLYDTMYGAKASTLDIAVFLITTDPTITPKLYNIIFNTSTSDLLLRLGDSKLSVIYDNSDNTKTYIKNITNNRITGIKVNIFKKMRL